MKKDAYYFPHYSNARNDSKLIKLRRVLGIEGYGMYFMILEVLRDQTDFKCNIMHIEDLAYEWHTSKEKLYSVVNDFELFEIDQDYFFSPKLVLYLQPYIEKSQRARDAANKRWKSLNANADANALQKDYKCNANQNASKVKESKVKESKVKESKVKENKEKYDYKKILLSEIEISDVSAENQNYLNIAKSFQKLIIKNCEELGVSTKDIIKTKGVAVDTIRLLLTNDNYTLEDAQNVFKHLENEIPENGFSWKQNILSIKTLRSKFDKLKIAANARKNKQQSNKKGISTERLAQLVHEEFGDQE